MMISGHRGNVREISAGPYRGMVIKDSSIDLFLQANGNPDNLFENNGYLLKSSGSTRSAIAELNDIGSEIQSEKLFVKSFLFKNLFHSLKPHFTKHRAQISWDVSWYLLDRSISVPEPKGYLTKLRGPFCLRGYFFCQALLNCSSLDGLTQDRAQLCNRLDAGGLISVLARNIASLHDNGVIHGDLKWSNILIKEDENQPWFVDFDSAKLHRHSPPPRAYARDLARFLLSGLEAGIEETILERLLDEYVNYRKLVRANIDEPVAKILEKLKHRHQKEYGDKGASSKTGTES
ncbi:MAG: lipopolysaccharide kinase InaA family protein [Syntrophobacterales bacterium]